MLVVVVIVLGVVLIRSDGTNSRSRSAVHGTTATTVPTVNVHVRATTTPTTVPRSSVNVLVANGSTTTGAAAFFTTKLKAAGWSTLAPTTAPKGTVSLVYYASAQQKAAQSVAAALGLKPTSVQPIPASPGITGATAADVVVVVGPSLASQVATPAATTTPTTAAPATTSTTTAPATTAPATTAPAAG